MFKLLALKGWVKSTWKSIVLFCKDRWELLAGALIGVLGVLAVRNRNQEKDLENTIKTSRDLRDQNIKISEDEANRVSEAIEEHAEREDQIRKDHEEKSERLERRVEELKEEILDEEKTSPGTIAKEINKLID